MNTIQRTIDEKFSKEILFQYRSFNESWFIEGFIAGGRLYPGIVINNQFLYGIILKNNRFLPGVVLDNIFVPGLLDNNEFIPGLLTENRFYPGIIADGLFVTAVFRGRNVVPGIFRGESFIPGTYITDGTFAPGIFLNGKFESGYFSGGRIIPQTYEALYEHEILQLVKEGFGLQSIRRFDPIGGLPIIGTLVGNIGDITITAENGFISNKGVILGGITTNKLLNVEALIAADFDLPKIDLGIQINIPDILGKLGECGIHKTTEAETELEKIRENENEAIEKIRENENEAIEKKKKEIKDSFSSRSGVLGVDRSGVDTAEAFWMINGDEPDSLIDFQRGSEESRGYSMSDALSGHTILPGNGGYSPNSWAKVVELIEKILIPVVVYYLTKGQDKESKPQKDGQGGHEGGGGGKGGDQSVDEDSTYGAKSSRSLNQLLGARLVSKFDKASVKDAIDDVKKSEKPIKIITEDTGALVVINHDSLVQLTKYCSKNGIVVGWNHLTGEKIVAFPRTLSPEELQKIQFHDALIKMHLDPIINPDKGQLTYV